MYLFSNKIIIQSNEIPIHICKNFLHSFPNNIPRYFKNIPKHFKDQEDKIFKRYTTLKTCSGFVNLFKRSLLFTCPYDIEIHIEKNGLNRYGFKGFVGSKSLNENFTIHPSSQFLDYVNTDYAFILKFNSFINIKSKYSFIISNPWWHLNNFEIIPGMVNPKGTSELNIFMPIKKDQKYLYIKQNTPLCYINFETSKQLKIVYDKTKYKDSDNLGLFYTFSNLKNKLLKNILK